MHLVRLPRRPRAGRGRALLALAPALLVAALVAAVLPAPRPVLAAPATAVQDLTLFAGPGEGYDALGYAPAGAALSVDGEAVDGFLPVSYDGVSGWAAAAGVAADGAALPVAEAPVETEAPVEAAPVADAAPAEAAPPAPEAMAPMDEAVVPAPEVEAAPVEAAAPAAAAAPPARRASGQNDIAQIIYEAADRYNQPRDDMLRVATCESGLDPNAVDPAGLYFGLFQFVPSTFAGTPYGEYDIFDPWANANAAGWMWSQGRRNEWVCQ